MTPDYRTPDYRTGIGYDVHQLHSGTGIWLGGHWIDCPYHLVGHSDADVLLHAVCDAILGAIGEDDIGLHFPPSDPQWKGAPSHLFIEHACKLALKKGAHVHYVDTIIIAEVPKITPHRSFIRSSLAKILGINETHVNIKATTTERLGFTGRKEGIAAQAIATVIFNREA